MGHSEWSVELKATTRALLANPPVSLGASLCVKNIDGRFGAMQVLDLLVYRWVVTEREGKIHRYCSIADLLLAGWAID